MEFLIVAAVESLITTENLDLYLCWFDQFEVMASSVVIIASSIAAGIALLTAAGIARNEYLYRLRRPTGEEEGGCRRNCSSCRRSCRILMSSSPRDNCVRCYYYCRSKLFDRGEPGDEEQDQPIDPIVSDAPKRALPQVDIVVITRKLLSEQVLSEAQGKLILGLVAKKDEKMYRLVDKYHSSSVDLTQNEGFIKAVVRLFAFNYRTFVLTLRAVQVRVAKSGGGKEEAEGTSMPPASLVSEKKAPTQP